MALKCQCQGTPVISKVGKFLSVFFLEQDSTPSVVQPLGPISGIAGGSSRIGLLAPFVHAPSGRAVLVRVVCV